MESTHRVDRSILCPSLSTYLPSHVWFSTPATIGRPVAWPAAILHACILACTNRIVTAGQRRHGWGWRIIAWTTPRGVRSGRCATHARGRGCMHSFAWMDRGREECEDDSVCVCVCVCARTLTDKEYTGYMLIRYRIPYSTRTNGIGVSQLAK